MMVKVSENVILFWKDGQLVCDNYAAREQFALSRFAEPLLRWFSNWRELGSLSKLDTASFLAQQLLDAGILIEEGSEAHQRERKLRTWDAWRQSTRYFHSSCRTFEDTPFLGLEEDGERLIEKADNDPSPPLYKEYPKAEKVPLPSPIGSADVNNDYSHRDFLEVLQQRRTSREYDENNPMDLNQLSTILYYVCGATHVATSIGAGEVLLKTSPSGGARQPIEVYPCLLNVEGADPGFYHYSVRDHELELVSQGDYQDQVPVMCGDQNWTGTASVVFFYTTVIERSMWKYQTPRYYRAMCMELGHFSQTFYLVSAWLGPGAFFVGALREESVEKKLGLDWTTELVLGANGVGAADLKTRAAGPVRLHV